MPVIGIFFVFSKFHFRDNSFLFRVLRNRTGRKFSRICAALRAFAAGSSLFKSVLQNNGVLIENHIHQEGRI
jgi:hypothetical protein